MTMSEQSARHAAVLEPEWDAASCRVRPYTITGGRTAHGGDELRLETLVSTLLEPGPRGRLARPELVTICELCRQVRSVAEVSALSGIPFGVLRVLIGDLVEQGLLRVHGAEQPADGPDRELLERVLNGLQRL